MVSTASLVVMQRPLRKQAVLRKAGKVAATKRCCSLTVQGTLRYVGDAWTVPEPMVHYLAPTYGALASDVESSKSSSNEARP